MNRLRPDRSWPEHRRDLARMSPLMATTDHVVGEHRRRWWTNQHFFDLHPVVIGVPPDTFYRAGHDVDAGYGPQFSTRLDEIEHVAVEVTNGWVKVTIVDATQRPHYIPFYGVRIERHYRGNVFTYDDVRVADPTVPGLAEAFAQRLRLAISQSQGLPTAEIEPASTPAGWYKDPSGRFELRYWAGDVWTEAPVSSWRRASSS